MANVAGPMVAVGVSFALADAVAVAELRAAVRLVAATPTTLDL
jgi:hypothetical protein